MLSERQPQRRRRGSGDAPRDVIAIDFVILADFAQAVGGKLYMMGGAWNIYHAQQYPVPLQFGLGIGILVPWSLTNQRFPFTFQIKKSEGPDLLGGGGDFEIGREPGIPQGMTQRVTIGLSGQMQLTEPGTYEVIVRAADDEKRISFEALPVQRSR